MFALFQGPIDTSLKAYNGYGYSKKDSSSPSYATYSYYNYDPTFGSGHDIYLADYANSNYNIVTITCGQEIEIFVQM